MAVKINKNLVEEYIGTKADREAMPVTNLPAGSTYVESDNGGKKYVFTGSFWLEDTAKVEEQRAWSYSDAGDAIGIQGIVPQGMQLLYSSINSSRVDIMDPVVCSEIQMKGATAGFLMVYVEYGTSGNWKFDVFGATNSGGPYGKITKPNDPSQDLSLTVNVTGIGQYIVIPVTCIGLPVIKFTAELTGSSIITVAFVPVPFM